jgi:hypothetical protein
MTKFRKKPVIIDATQFFRAEAFDGKHVLLDGVETRVTPGGREFFIRTLEGDHLVSEGDWIIIGVKGERYPCKPDIFEATYEPA